MNTNYRDTRQDEKASFRPPIIPLLTALIGAIGAGGWMYSRNGLDGITTAIAIVAGYWGFQIGKGLQRLPEQQIPNKLNGIVKNIRYNAEARIKYIVRFISIIIGAILGWYGGNSLILASLGGIAGLMVGEILRFFWKNRQDRKGSTSDFSSSKSGGDISVLEISVRLIFLFAPVIIGLVLAGYWGYTHFGWIGAVITGFLGGVFGFIVGAAMNA